VPVISRISNWQFAKITGDEYSKYHVISSVFLSSASKNAKIMGFTISSLVKGSSHENSIDAQYQLHTSVRTLCQNGNNTMVLCRGSLNSKYVNYAY